MLGGLGFFPADDVGRSPIEEGRVGQLGAGLVEQRCRVRDRLLEPRPLRRNIDEPGERYETLDPPP